MQMSTYLNFSGDCEAAFALYARALGGQVGELFRYGGSPMAAPPVAVPPLAPPALEPPLPPVAPPAPESVSEPPVPVAPPLGVPLSLHAWERKTDNVSRQK